MSPGVPQVELLLDEATPVGTKAPACGGSIAIELWWPVWCLDAVHAERASLPLRVVFFVVVIPSFGIPCASRDSIDPLA